MKKIFTTIAVTALIFSAKAQSNQKSNSQVLASSVANTMKENPHNPLVNGIPYDQYKTQVQAEQKQRAAKEAAAKVQQKQMLEKEVQLILPPNPNLAEKPKK